MPLQGEALHNPFYAAIRLSEAARRATPRGSASSRLPDTDSVIMLSDWNWTLSRARRERLQKWVEAGGRLVIDGSFIGDFEEFESGAASANTCARRSEDEGRGRR